MTASTAPGVLKSSASAACTAPLVWPSLWGGEQTGPLQGPGWVAGAAALAGPQDGRPPGGSTLSSRPWGSPSSSFPLLSDPLRSRLP